MKQLLYQLKNKIRTMIWILGHRDITHNEEVDKLAKEVSKMQTVTQYALPRQGQRYIIKTQIRK
jgi:ribonuclease HI